MLDVRCSGYRVSTMLSKKRKQRKAQYNTQNVYHLYCMHNFSKKKCMLSLKKKKTFFTSFCNSENDPNQSLQTCFFCICSNSDFCRRPKINPKLGVQHSSASLTPNLVTICIEQSEVNERTWWVCCLPAQRYASF